MSTAFVLITCQLGFEEDVINSLKYIEGVSEIQGTFGAYDIVAKITTEGRNRLRQVITQKIRKIERIRATLTLYETGQ